MSLRVAALVLAPLAACVANPRFLLDATTDTGAAAETHTTRDVPGTDGETSDTPAATTDDPGTATGTTDATTSGTSTTGIQTGDLDSSEVGSDATGSGETSSGETSSGETSGESSGGASVCGDGVADDGEQCDDGPDNDDAGACTSACIKATCGDSLVRAKGDAPEQCDDGPSNGTAPGKCSSDCAAVIAMTTYKIVVAGGVGVPGTLHAPNSQVVSGIPAGDDACKIKVGAGYKVLAADGNKRVASKTPWTGEGQVEWVLKPYTAYTDGGGALLGITGKEALLGIQSGDMIDLLKPISGGLQAVWTGLLPNWVAAPNNCVGWSTGNPIKTGASGNPSLPDAYLDDGIDSSCGELLKLYCVQQP